MRIRRTLGTLCVGMLLLGGGIPMLQGGSFSVDVSAGGGGDLLGLDLNPVNCSSNTHVFAPSASAVVSCSGNITAKYGVFTSPFEGTIFNFAGSATVTAGGEARGP